MYFIQDLIEAGRENLVLVLVGTLFIAPAVATLAGYLA